MTQHEMKTCLNCARSEEKTPLLLLTFKGETTYICAQCLPLLIHKTHVLSEKLPGMEILNPTEH
ncbi:MAG: hypothetical protein ACKOBL_17860 [Chloroflexota bacterium]|jgi:hypothetical protein